MGGDMVRNFRSPAAVPCIWLVDSMRVTQITVSGMIGYAQERYCKNDELADLDDSHWPRVIHNLKALLAQVYSVIIIIILRPVVSAVGHATDDACFDTRIDKPSWTYTARAQVYNFD